MKKLIYLVLGILFLASCTEKEFDRQPMKIQGIDEAVITGELVGDDYIWTWPEQAELKMQVATYANGNQISKEIVEGNTYKHSTVDTNIEFTYVFKVTDETNFSTGTIKKYLRDGATTITGASMSQLEKAEGYDAKVVWDKAADATSILFTATNGSRNISETLKGDAVEYIIEDVNFDEFWQVSIVAKNDKGTSLSCSTSLKIGKTAIGFLSIYATPEEHIANGDDDEVCAWLWLNKEYPNATFVPMGSISSPADVEPYRVLFWMRDLENVGEDALWNMPEPALTALPSIKEWYKNGGNLLLWSHAIAYITNLGRIDGDMLRSNDRTIGLGAGGYNPDVWKMAVQLHPGSRFKKDFSSHPIYKGLEVETNDRTKLIAFIGAGWKEDHNCLFFNIPSVLTGIGNQEEACYNEITSTYGIYPLGTWDSQIDWVSQLNVWEAQQGNTEFKGTILCIGNGGCEFSMKNADGTPDISAYPTNNPYQENVLTLAKNSLEYLKTR